MNTRVSARGGADSVGPGRRRPEVERLSEPERDHVRVRVRSRRLRCPACGHRRFEVGDALYLGYLFVTAALDEYMVALTCTNPRCPVPRSGVTLRRADFRGD